MQPGAVKELARWCWPMSVHAVLLAMPPGLSLAAARQAWQAALFEGTLCTPVLRDGARVGWRSGGGEELRVSYGYGPQREVSVSLVAWRSGAPEWADWAVDWAVDCVADEPLAEGADLLALYGAEANPDFPLAWAALEAAAKRVGGLREHHAPPQAQVQVSQRVAGWVVALAASG